MSAGASYPPGQQPIVKVAWRSQQHQQHQQDQTQPNFPQGGACAPVPSGSSSPMPFYKGQSPQAALPGPPTPPVPTRVSLKKPRDSPCPARGPAFGESKTIVVETSCWERKARSQTPPTPIQGVRSIALEASSWDSKAGSPTHPTPIQGVRVGGSIALEASSYESKAGSPTPPTPMQGVRVGGSIAVEASSWESKAGSPTPLTPMQVTRTTVTTQQHFCSGSRPGSAGVRRRVSRDSGPPLLYRTSPQRQSNMGCSGGARPKTENIDDSGSMQSWSASPECAPRFLRLDTPHTIKLIESDPLENSRDAYSIADNLFRPTCDKSLSTSEVLDKERSSKQEVMNSMLERLQRSLEEHEHQMHTKFIKLSESWEERFVALEQALNTGLETATVATTSMNDRLAKFLVLAEMLEGAVQRVTQSGKSIDLLSRRVAKVEDLTTRKIAEVQNDVISITEELSSYRGSQPSAESAQGAEGYNGEAGRSGGGAILQPSILKLARDDLDRLMTELSEERSERLQLAEQVRGHRYDLERLHTLLGTASSQVSTLTQELTSVVAGDGLGSLLPECRERWNSQLESLYKEICPEAEGRSLLGRSQGRNPRLPGLCRGATSRFGSEPIERIEEEDEEELQSATIAREAGSLGAPANKGNGFINCRG